MRLILAIPYHQVTIYELKADPGLRRDQAGIRTFDEAVEDIAYEMGLLSPRHHTFSPDGNGCSAWEYWSNCWTKEKREEHARRVAERLGVELEQPEYS